MATSSISSSTSDAVSAAEPGRYRGRFAPSPTGPLHFGSLVAAVGSYLDARANSGQWLVRIEDIDAPRTVPGAADHILLTLEGFGFEWDGEVIHQSRRLDLYHATLVRLQLSGLAYPCACSRSEIAASANRASIDGGLLYPGTCRSGLKEGAAARAWRLRVPSRDFFFRDRVQGESHQNLERDVGDFVLLRADGQYAYQLAVVVDDAAQGVTTVVRGADLLDSTARQIWLQQCLGVPAPAYAHLPVALNAAGEKLSKQTKAAAVDPTDGIDVLHRVMRFLGQEEYPDGTAGSLRDFWEWAIAAWDLARVPGARAVSASFAEASSCQSKDRSADSAA